MPFFILVFMRSILAFFTLLFLTRLMGKKQISQLTFFDYVVGITIGSIASTLSVELENRVLSSLTALLVWGFLPVILSIVSLKSVTFRKTVDGEPAVVVRDGKILEENMAEARYNVDDLLMQLRENKVFNLADVELAYLEPNGRLSVMKKAEAEPLTPRRVGIPAPRLAPPVVVVIDGSIMHNSLEASGHTEGWLRGELQKLGVQDLSEVVLAQIQSTGELFIDLREDEEPPPEPLSKPQQILYAELLRLRADLEFMAALVPSGGSGKKGKDPEVGDHFHALRRNANRVETVINRLGPWLTGQG